VCLGEGGTEGSVSAWVGGCVGACLYKPCRPYCCFVFLEIPFQTLSCIYYSLEISVIGWVVLSGSAELLYENTCVHSLKSEYK
jgi:hypothetical protein